MIFSDLTNNTIIQSPQAMQLMNQIKTKNKIIKSHPIMWGKTHNNQKKINKSNKKFNILHAGTYKILCARPLIYETSNEYVEGLIKLVNAVSDIKDAELTIRIREIPECSIDSVKKLLPKSNNLKISTTGDFVDDLNTADLLISFSSTTIEEALYSRKPVALYGGKGRYQHLNENLSNENQSSRRAVYSLSDKKLAESIKNIIFNHHNESLLDKKELKNFIWDENVYNWDRFINMIAN